MKDWDLIIVGAGAAGMMAAASAAQCGVSVLLLEKMEKAGRKVRITGKGRCNITNTKNWEEFSTHVHPKSNFLKPSFFSFSNKDTLDFFEKIGLKCVVERGDRIFPASGMAGDVVKALVDHLLSLGVEIRYNSKVKKINIDGDKVCSVTYGHLGKSVTEKASAIIIATGGLSYPLTGSDGDGYTFAKELGINVTDCFPSLTALRPGFDYFPLKWLLLKNVELTLYVGGNPVQNEMGELEFTDNGIEGSIGFRVSRRAVQAIRRGESVYAVIDIKPAVDKGSIVSRLVKDFETDKVLGRVLRHYLPEQIIDSFISFLPKKTNSQNNFDTRAVNEIADLMKGWKMDIVDYTSYERAVITAGGVSQDEIISKRMSSRKFENLFFAGEVIDLDGDTGGYNLQIAFSTGYAAGREATYLIRKSRESLPE